MRYLAALLVLILCFPFPALASPGPRGIVIWIELDRMRLTVYRDGEAISVYPIAAGKRETPSSPQRSW